jgi:PAS domain-containing protein
LPCRPPPSAKPTWWRRRCWRWKATCATTSSWNAWWRTHQPARKNRAQLETLYASAPVGLSYVDAELRVVRINDYLAALNQQPVAAHLGHHIGDMIPDNAGAPAGAGRLPQPLASGLPLVNIERSGYPAAAPSSCTTG